MKPALPEFPPHSLLPESELLFHPQRAEDRCPHPLLGLTYYGPYSRSTVNTVLDPIRLAVIAPAGSGSSVDSLLKEFNQRHWPRERLKYLPEFLGFSRIFGLNIVKSDILCELSTDLEREIGNSPAPHIALAEAITRALSVVETRRERFDVAVIYLPIRWERAFYGPDGDDFDLHDYLKAVAALKGIPTQVIKEDSALQYPCRCSVMWRLSIALYCKAGGIPWKLADADPQTAFVGLSYALRLDASEKPRFITCCSQVFDSDGAGLEFIGYETDDIHVERDNPFLSRPDMRRVMARSLALYQRRHAGRTPKKVIVHKSTEFKPDEIDGCFDAWRVAEGLDLLQVQQDSGWRGVLIDPPATSKDKKGLPAAYPCQRGTFLPLDGYNVLVWTQGNAPKAALDGKNYYKEGKSIPAPLVLKRYAGHGAWDDSCRAIIELVPKVGLF